ncbi:transporter substrate-binding domain-containing protein [Desulfobacterales bacterium HSG16]|nr:transporter substrate-binding domain-containing protein [Desulfobacterales bacterium HSG16]
MKTILKIFFCILIASAGNTDRVYAEKELIFSTDGDGILSKISARVLQEAYHQLGIQISYKALPPYRALQMSNSGKMDGELTRIAGLENEFKNLIPVSVPINSLEHVVFTKNLQFTVEGWESLRPYTLAIRRGIKKVEKGTRGMKRTLVPSNEQTFFMLDKGRVDIAISARIIGLKTLSEMKLKNIRILEPPLGRIDLYHYLHKNHEHIVEPVTNILRKMEQEGRIAEIKKQTVSLIK